jgi:hypothetical protein
VGDEKGEKKESSNEKEAGSNLKEVDGSAEGKGRSRDQESGKNISDFDEKDPDHTRKNDGESVHYKDCDIFEDVASNKSEETTESGKVVDGEESGDGMEPVQENITGEGKTMETEVENGEVIVIDSSESDLEEGEISDISTTSSSSSDEESESDSPMEVEEGKDHVVIWEGH